MRTMSARTMIMNKVTNKQNTTSIMKAEFKITEITHDELVNLLSCATDGSNWLGLNYYQDDYDALSEEQKTGGCAGVDSMADLLLAGKSVELIDAYCMGKDEFYGTLPHRYDEDGDMRYTVTLEDIKRGIEKAFKDDYLRACLYDLINDDACNLDGIEADNLIQCILFGEIIYG